MMNQTSAIYAVIALCCSALLANTSAINRKRSTPSSIKRSIGGVVGHSVHLHCSLSMTNPPSIQWFDKVFNDGEDPQLIYSSENGQVVEDHPNQENLKVGTDFTLTISHVQIDRDGGEYFCRSTMADGSQHEIKYDLTVFELPRCSNVTHFMNGQEMSLDCQLGFGGSQPTIDWYRTVANGAEHENQETDNNDHHGHHHRHHQPELITSVDMFDIIDTPVARKVVKHKAHPIDDGSTYRCRATVGDSTKECHLKLSVTYSVQDLHIMPKGEEVLVGETVVCSAKGNPVPDVELNVYLERDSEPVAGSEMTSSGPGSQKFDVGEQHKDGTLRVTCSATNTIVVDSNPVTERISSNHTYRVTVPATTTIVTTTKSHHHHHSNPADHGHMSHQSHPPRTNDKQQEQPKAIVAADTDRSKATNSRSGSSDPASAAGSMAMTVLLSLFIAAMIN